MDKKFRQMNNLVSTDSLVHYAENGGNIRKQYLNFTNQSNKNNNNEETSLQLKS